MSHRSSVPAAAAALAALLAAALVHAPLQAQEGEADQDDRRAEVRVIRAGAPVADGGWLGVRVEDLDAETAGGAGLDAPRGARITGLREESPAAEAGLREGDVLVRFAGEEVRSVAHLVRLVRETPPGREVPVRVLRDGDARELSVEVGERPGRHFQVRGAPDRVGMDEERMQRLHERMERVREHVEKMGDSAASVAPRLHALAMRGGPPRLGVRMQPLTDQLAEHFGVGERGGVLVASVREGSAAAEAGLEAGDVLVRFGDRDVEDPGDLAEAVREAEAGPVSVTLVRDGAERSLTVELPEREKTGWLHPGADGFGAPPAPDVGLWRFRVPGGAPAVEISAPAAPPAPPAARATPIVFL